VARGGFLRRLLGGLARAITQPQPQPSKPRPTTPSRPQPGPSAPAIPPPPIARRVPAPSSLHPRTPRGQYIQVITTQGIQILDRSALSQDTATLIGQHWNAVKAVVNDTSSRYDLRDFEGVTVAPGMELQASEDLIYDLAAEGELDAEDIYAA
jgi:hypothetical protein